MSIGYGWEQLHKAVYSMSASQRSLQDRLEAATAGALIHAKADEDIPPELREEFKSVIQALTCVEAQGGEGTIAATCATMDDQTAIDLIHRIVGLYDEITRIDAVRDGQLSRGAAKRRR